MCKSLFIIGIISELIKIFYYIIRNEDKLGGTLPKTDLPFHLCSIQIIFIAVICYTNNEKIKRILYSFMMPSCLFGGIAAILIPTSSAISSWVITFQYFIYHIALIVFALHLITSEEFKITIKDYINCLKFILALMFFSIYINSILYDGESNINFMYVVSPPQEGLPYLNENEGWFVYIIRYAILIFTCISACYVKPIFVTIKNKINKKSKTQADSVENQSSTILETESTNKDKHSENTSNHPTSNKITSKKQNKKDTTA